MIHALAGCTAVKPYQRAYLNDAAMQSGKLPVEKFDENMQTYREGASGGGTGKAERRLRLQLTIPSSIQ